MIYKYKTIFLAYSISFVIYHIITFFYQTNIIENKKIFNDYSHFYNRKYRYNCNIFYYPSVKYTFYRYIILTLTNPCNILKRKVQRKYRTIYPNILYIYVVGYSRCNNIICYEHRLYRDLLFLNLKNGYFNIPNLFLESIRWVNLNFKYDYLIKWDDDIIVNIPLLFLFSDLQNKLLYYGGYIYNKTKICRDRNKICYIPYTIYNYSYLPLFAASGFLIIIEYLPSKFYYYSRIYKSYMIRDDQYLGVLCKILSIKPVSLNKYYIRKLDFKLKNSIKNNYLAYHIDNYNELYYFSIDR